MNTAADKLSLRTSDTLQSGVRRRRPPTRCGKVLVLLAILLPTLFGIMGLTIDGGLLMSEHRRLQHTVDAAATAAATDLRLNKGAAAASATARELVHVGNRLPDASVTVNIPPASGAFAGRSQHVEVIARHRCPSHFMHVLDGIVDRTVEARSVAGVVDGTAGAAVVVLDPVPNDLSLGGIEDFVGGINVNALVDALLPQTGVGELLAGVPVVGPLVSNLLNASLGNLLPEVTNTLRNDVIAGVELTPLPTLIAGMEVEGLGRLLVDGAIHVNTQWGGVDENGEPAGIAVGPPYALACMPLLPTTRVRARDIRVVGGVDDQQGYQPFESQGPNPLQAGRLPVDDPLLDLPVPSLASDSENLYAGVVSEPHCTRIALSPAQADSLLGQVLGSVTGLLRPLVDPLLPDLATILTEPTLQPGVYDSITVLSPLGGARFEPGIYVIRNRSPITNLSLCILGPVRAEGVMFYLTDSPGFDASTGGPDIDDDPQSAPANPLPSLLPSTVIVTLLPGAHLTGLESPGSPFDGMLIYQRRTDRRPILLEAQRLLSNGELSGTVYAKWAHVIFLGGAGSYDLRFAVGTMRFVTLFDTTLAPVDPFPPARDVLLLE